MISGKGLNVKKLVIALVNLCLLGVLLVGCQESSEPDAGLNDQQVGIDASTPATAQPFIKQAESPSGAVNAPPGNSWKLAWSDEFGGSQLDSSKWGVINSSKSRNRRPEIGVRDWWWRPNHVFLDGNGKLTLRASKVDNDTMYTGAVNSNDKFETRYGYFETRIKIADTAKGSHTAFWFHQGETPDSFSDGTANNGAEIDVFESAWLGDYTKSVLHIDGYGENHQANTKRYDTPGIHEGYHTFGMHWTPEFIKIYYDGELKSTYSEEKWRVLVPEFIWLSVGASFGDGDFQSQPVGILSAAKVDYVRVWKPDDGDGVINPSADTVRIVNKETGKSLRTLGTDDDAQIVQADPNHSGDWTHWTRQPSGDYFYFVNATSGKYFRPITGETGSSLQLKPSFYGGAWSQWDITDTGDGDGSVYIKNKETGHYIRPESSANNAEIVLTPSSNKDDWQKWTLEPVN